MNLLDSIGRGAITPVGAIGLSRIITAGAAAGTITTTCTDSQKSTEPNERSKTAKDFNRIEANWDDLFADDIVRELSESLFPDILSMILYQFLPAAGAGGHHVRYGVEYVHVMSPWRSDQLFPQNLMFVVECRDTLVQLRRAMHYRARYQRKILQASVITLYDNAKKALADANAMALKYPSIANALATEYAYASPTAALATEYAYASSTAAKDLNYPPAYDDWTRLSNDFSFIVGDRMVPLSSEEFTYVEVAKMASRNGSLRLYHENDFI